MSLWLKQSTSIEIKVGVFVDSVDGVTAETGLTITSSEVLLAKNEGDWAAKNESTSLVHESNGWYRCLLNTTDTNTLGILRLQIAESGALPVWAEYMVLPANVYDSLLSTDLLQVDVTQWLGVAPLALSSQLVQVLANGIGSGIINSTALGADTGLKPIRSGTTEAASSASTLALDSGASSTTDFYKGARAYLTGGTGAGQSRLITAYNATTKVATIEPNWITNPGNGTTTFAILPDAYALGIATPGLAEINTQVDTALADYDGPTFAELDARTDAIEADTQDIQARLPDVLVGGRLKAIVQAFSAGVIDAASMAADMNSYTTRTWIAKEGTSNDKYIIQWAKNGQVLTSGITLPKIRVFNESGTDLIAETAMTEIGSTQSFKFEEATNKLAAGEIYMVEAKATIDGSVRTDRQPVMRDSA